MKAVIKVRLKQSILDPQGKAVNNALLHLGFKEVGEVRIGKYIEMKLNTKDKEKAIRVVEESCKKLLSNPVIEEYSYQLVEE